MGFPFPFSYWASTGLSPSANLGLGFNGPIFAVAQQSDGKLLIGGNFTTYRNNMVAPGLVRINLNGTLDTAFDINLGTGFVASTTEPSFPKRNVASIKVWSDGSIYVGGDFTSLNGTTVNQLVKLDTNGNLDGTFTFPIVTINPGATGYGTPVILTIEEGLQNDLVIGGQWNDIAGYTPSPQYAASVDPITGLQSNNVPIFARGSTQVEGIYKIKRISGNRLMFAGGFDRTQLNGSTDTTRRAAIICTTSGLNYVLDTTFNWTGAPLNSQTVIQGRTVFDFVEKTDGKFIFVGNFIGTTPNSIRAASSTGGNDAVFIVGNGFTSGPSLNPSIRARGMTLFESGSFIYAGGTLTAYKGITIDTGICRIDKTNGTIDTTFNPTTGGVAGNFTGGDVGPAVTQIGPVLSNTSGSFFIYGDFQSYDGGVTGSIAQPSATGSRYLVP